MNTAQVAYSMDQAVVIEPSTVLVDLLDDTLKCRYEKALVEGRSVVYYVFAQVPVDLLHQEMMHEIINKLFAKFSDKSDAADKIGESPFLQIPSWHKSPLSEKGTPAKQSPRTM